MWHGVRRYWGQGKEEWAPDPVPNGLGSEDRLALSMGFQTQATQRGLVKGGAVEEHCRQQSLGGTPCQAGVLGNNDGRFIP